MTTDSLQERIKALATDASYLMTVPALKGRMGSIDYYVITLPYSVMSRYVTTTDRNLPAKERENRKPTPTRYGVIADYMTKNPESYRFSSITCTYGRNGTEKPYDWVPAGPSGDASRIGLLTLDQRDPLIIVDGQHRFEGIKKAIEHDQSLADDMVSIVLFPYVSLKAAQQLFSDLNRTAKKTTKSLDILFDHRDVVNRVTQALVERVSVFKDRVNVEDAGIPAQSPQMFTLAGIYQATEPIIDAIHEASLIREELAERDAEGRPIDNEAQYVDFLVQVWEFIASQFPEWGKVARGELNITVERSRYIHWNSGVLSAVGELVAAAMREKKQGWMEPVKIALTHAETRGWKREEPHWQGIVTAGTLVLPRSVVRPQLKAYLKNLANLPLTPGDQRNLEIIEERKKQLGVS
ncbi:MAG: DGQHR domain-containing protein [Chloroflexi bacterium]|nr:DGQHR domain-containing protein [Chloroflexota bacterium]